MGLSVIAMTMESLISWGFWSNVLLAAFGLGMVIFVHELGHFAVAKWCGVRCDKFYLGFDIYGLKLFKFRWGETEYGIGILPLGGYVKMLGQDDNPARAAEEAKATQLASTNASGQTVTTIDPRSYTAKSVPQRMAIISAGVIMNLIFAYVASTVAYCFDVRYLPTVFSRVQPNDPAWLAGLRPGDEALKVNGVERPRFDRDLMSSVSLANLETGVDLLLKRRGVEEPFSVNVIPQRAEGRGRPTIGVAPPASTTLGIPEKPGPSLGYPIEKADPPLKNGDKIVKANGQPVATAAELEAVLIAHPSGPLKLTVERKAPAGENPADGAMPTTIESVLPPWPRKDVGLTMVFGPIAGVQAGSPAAEAGVRAFDQLVSMDGDPIGDPLTLSERLRKRAGQKVKLALDRANEPAPISVELTLRKADWIDAISSPKMLVSIPELGIALDVGPDVAAVASAGPAADSGIRSGDTVHKAEIVAPDAKVAELLNDNGLTAQIVLSGDNAGGNWPWLMEVLQQYPPGSKLKLTLAGGKTAEITPRESTDFFEADRGLPLQYEFRTRTAASFADALWLGARETKDDVLLVYRFLQKLWSGQISATELRGPGTIARVASGAASQGIPELLLFLAMLSANLAVVNFLPIPVLDGGHMVFLAAEGIRGKPVSERFITAMTLIGLCLIVSLMVFVIGMDVKDMAGW